MEGQLAAALEAQMLTAEAMKKAAGGLQELVRREAENNSRDWPKFDGKVLSYAM